MTRKHVIIVWLALAIAVVCQASLFAQAPTGSILGTVKDPSGAVVPKATVTILNQNSNFKRSAPSSDTGDFEFTLVDAAPYTLTVEASGFKKYVQPNILLTVRQILRVDVTVQVGQAAETVTVTATAAPVNSESATITETYSAAGMKASPIPLPMDYFPTERIGNYSLTSVGAGGANYKINGARMNQLRYVVDGRTPTYYGSVPMSAVEEIKMVSVNANAEYTMPATIQATSKGGTNAFHASADGVLNHPGLASIGPSYYKRGATVGSWSAAFAGSGPVVIPKIYNGRDRTWFSAEYETTKAGGGFWQPIISVPTVRMHGGDFSHYRDSSGNLIRIYDPLTGVPFGGAGCDPADNAACNVVPANRINPVSANIAALYPAPNRGSDPDSTFENYTINFNYYGVQSHNRFIRFDQKITNKDTFNFNHLITVQKVWFDTAASGFSKVPGLYNAQTNIYQRAFAFAETHVFSPTIVNEARFAYDELLQPTGATVNGQDILSAWGITGIDPSLDFTGVPNIKLTPGASAVTNSLAGIGEVYTPATSKRYRYSYLDNTTWQRGKHTINAGANYSRLYASSVGSAAGNPFGDYTFSGRMTNGNDATAGNPWADLLLGYPDTVVRYTPRSASLAFNYMFGAYIQDDWKVTPRLTFNYGVRYDLEGSPVDLNGLYYSFDRTNGALAFPTQFAMNHVSSAFNPAIPLELASYAKLPGKLIPVDKNNFAPRLGFAYRPFNNATSVIRAAYGIYTAGKLGADYNRTEDNYLNTGGPFGLSETFINQFNANHVPTLAFPSPFLSSTGGGGNTAASYDVSFTNPNYHDSYVQQWNVSYEQEWWKTAFRFSYVGSKSTNLVWSRNINQMEASTTPFDISDCSNTETARPNPTCRRNYFGFNSVNEADNGGNSIYHSAQFEFTHPFTKGFQLHGGYIWAKELTDVEESSYLGVVGTNTYDRKYNRGPSNWVPPQRVQVDLVWSLPLGRGRRFLASAPGIVNQIVGGWQFSAYANYFSGTPFSVTYTGRDTTGTGITSGRADRIASGRISSPTQNNWFDPSAFVAPPCGAGSTEGNCTPLGRFGTSGRNIIYGPTTQWDYGRTEMAALQKSFPLYKEKLKFNFAMYVTNPFNRNYLLTPNTNISDPTNVGKMSRYGNRTVQLGGRFEF